MTQQLKEKEKQNTVFPYDTLFVTKVEQSKT